MNTTGRITAYVISLIMALTCFMPLCDYVYGETGDGQTQTTQPQQSTQPQQTTQPQTTQPKQTTDPNANFTGVKNGVYYVKGKPYTGKANGYYYEKGRKKTGLAKGTYYVNGKPKTGWVKKIYYYKGKKKTGWVTNKAGKKVYYCKQGKPLKGIKKIKNVWYEFNKNSGRFVRKIGDDMDKKAQGYYSRTKYLVLVSYDKHQVRIYKGEEKKWKRIKNFKCSLGKSSTPTPTGTFKITKKGRYFNTGSNGRCWYWTGFIGTEYLFHSVIYNRNSSPTRTIDSRLGKDISHGCIRLKLENAKWLYYNVSKKSKVVIKRKF